jgi:hypothetical protein
MRVARLLWRLCWCAVDTVGGSMRRCNRCEDRCTFGARERGCRSATAALHLRRWTKEGLVLLHLSSTARRRRRSDCITMARRWLSLCLLQLMRGSMQLLQSMRGSMRLYDGSEEAVALLGVVDALIDDGVALAFTRGRLISSNDRIRPD